MAMLTAYTDDSGTHSESEVAVAAGFVSDVGRWGPGKFETDWKVALRVAGILEKGFHTTDFKAGWGPYRNWSEQEKNSLYDALIQAINKHTMFGFSAAVKKDDYDELVTGRLREKLGGHYRFVVAACVFGIQRKLRSGPLHVPEPIKYVFAQGTKGNDEVYNLFQELSKFPGVKGDFGIEGVPPFEPAKSVCQLQASERMSGTPLKPAALRDL